MKESHRDIIIRLLRAHKRVTLHMLFAEGAGYSGRNRIAELRREGWQIESFTHEKGRPVSENGWSLVSEPRRFREEADGQYCFT